LSAEQAGRVRANLQAQAKIRGTGNVAKAVAADAAFHAQFVEFLGNREISRVMDRLRERMQRVITRVFHLAPARIDASCDEHAAIAAAVLAGDGGKAADLVARHLDAGKRLILSPRDG
jgi:DNA-binding GntR family transcriptional regulator